METNVKNRTCLFRNYIRKIYNEEKTYDGLGEFKKCLDCEEDYKEITPEHPSNNLTCENYFEIIKIYK